MKTDCPTIADIRGIGLMIGVELSIEETAYIKSASSGGFLSTARKRTSEDIPPLTADRGDIDTAMKYYMRYYERSSNEKGPVTLRDLNKDEIEAILKLAEKLRPAEQASTSP